MTRTPYPPELKAKAVTLAVLSGNESGAARELGIPQQRVSEWVRDASSGDIQLFVKQKMLEAAAGVVDRLPDVLELLVSRLEHSLRDEEIKWTGTQLQGVTTGVAILIDKMQALTGNTEGRFATHARVLDSDDLVSQALARSRTGS